MTESKSGRELPDIESGGHPDSNGVADPSSNNQSNRSTSSPGGWTKIFKKIYEDPALPPVVKNVYVTLAFRVNANRMTKTKHKTLAKAAGLSVATVKVALKHAEKIGLIDVTPTRGGENWYRLHDYNSDTPYLTSHTVTPPVSHSVTPVDKLVDNSETAGQKVGNLSDSLADSASDSHSTSENSTDHSVNPHGIHSEPTRNPLEEGSTPPQNQLGVARIWLPYIDLGLDTTKIKNLAATSSQPRVIQANVLSTDFQLKRRSTEQAEAS